MTDNTETSASHKPHFIRRVAGVAVAFTPMYGLVAGCADALNNNNLRGPLIVAFSYAAYDPALYLNDWLQGRYKSAKEAVKTYVDKNNVTRSFIVAVGMGALAAVGGSQTQKMADAHDAETARVQQLPMIAADQDITIKARTLCSGEDVQRRITKTIVNNGVEMRLSCAP